MGFFAGLDLGGSHARIMLADVKGNPLAKAATEGLSLNIASEEQAFARFSHLIDKTLAPLGQKPQDCLGACVAASGVDSPTLAQKCRAVFERIGFPAETLLIVNDCEVFLWRAYQPAIILTVGTGSIAFGRDAEGRVVRTGGWGHLLSDEGSGFDMGLRTLRAVANHMDGRAQCTALHRLFCNASPLRQPVDIDHYAIHNLHNKKEIAALAPLLLAAAQEGDPIAAHHLEECTGAHAQLILDTCQKLALPQGEAITLYFWGGILTECPAMAAALRKKMASLLPNARFQLPEKSALETALAVVMERFGQGA